MKKEADLSKYKATIPKQVRKYISSQLLYSVVVGFIGTYIMFSANSFFQKLICMILILFHFFTLYSVTYEIADHDTKSYSTLKPHTWKGFAFSAVIALLSAVFLAAYAAAWKSGSLDSAVSIVFNILFVIWSMPYYPIVYPDHGSVQAAGIIVMFLLPIISSGIGYYAGMKHFDLTAVTKKFIYERKNNK